MKMQIKHCLEACPTERQEWLLYKVVGNYMCVGFANMNNNLGHNTGWLVPVWRRWDNG